MDLTSILVPTLTGGVLILCCLTCCGYCKKRNQVKFPTAEPVVIPIISPPPAYNPYSYTTGQVLPPPVNPNLHQVSIPIYIPENAYTQKQGVGGQGYLQPIQYPSI